MNTFCRCESTEPNSSAANTVAVAISLTVIIELVDQGMIFVPIGDTFGAGMFEMEKVKGGSPYGAGSYAWDGSRQTSEQELEQAFRKHSTRENTLLALLRNSRDLLYSSLIVNIQFYFSALNGRNFPFFLQRFRFNCVNENN
ncbi:hypothetical protein RHMOL_Rhmol02G0125900 [Rhododendron molle]|uniref:Uncharacterized protein n=1 Tax=Rhododendron molle TaxID=49168 RepID=A0ACC0PQQ9_RHOML|nr:hypothetical protein RHMOL_Rhmol02G0125900 [Rhododendron molle]